MAKDNKVDKLEEFEKMIGFVCIILGYNISIVLMCVSALCMVVSFQSWIISFVTGLIFLVLGVCSFYEFSKMKKKYLGD